MDKPLFVKDHNALEYNHLLKDIDNMNFYSAKLDENEYVIVDDYDCDSYDIWSEVQIVLLENDKLLCKREGKYGVVNLEGWIIIPFVYDKFEKRTEINGNMYNVLLGNRWGIIDSSGKEFCRIKYSNPIPILKFSRKVSDNMLCRKAILVEDADTHRKGLVNFDGKEIIPAIYSKIERSENWDYAYVNLGAIEEAEHDCAWNGVWGCYNWQGKEIIPVKYHVIHYIDSYFIAGDDEYKYDEMYYGTYDLYDSEGTMIIGGFNNCQIGTNYFILNFGMVINSYCETTYWGNVEYGDKLVKKLNCDKMCSIIVNKELVSYIPRHLIGETREEIEYEYDFLCNNIPRGEGFLIGEYPKLCKGKRYDENDKLLKGISVFSASALSDNVVMYSSNKEVIINGCSIVRLKGLVFCNESKVITPAYIDAKSINDELFFYQKENGLVGIRNVTKELLKSQFDLITNPYNNVAIGFKIKYVEDEIYQCECCLLEFCEDTIHQEDVVEMTGLQLYELLYSTLGTFDGWKSFELSGKHKILIEQYWEHIPYNGNNTNRFWYPSYKDFEYLGEHEHYEKVRDSMFDDSAGSCNWSYYNDGLDIDQQDERFWNF